MSDSKASERGFTKVPNRLLAWLYRAELSPSAMRVMLVLVRQTLGYQRQSCRYTVDRIHRWSGVSRRSVQTALHQLDRLGHIELELPTRARSGRISIAPLLRRAGS